MKHLGLIPDGNRRWASLKNKPLINAYMKSIYNICDIIENIFLYNDVDTISIYLTSKDNLERSKDELYTILQSGIFMLENLLPSILKKTECSVTWIGMDWIDTTLMDDSLNDDFSKFKQLATELENINRNTARKKINGLIGYCAYKELEASKNLGNISNKSNSLLVKKDVDMVIRTGGDHRFSGFLPLQTRYANLIVFDEYSPDVDYETIKEVLRTSENFECKYGI
jgi:undecaprenyl diphosphate synthase